MSFDLIYPAVLAFLLMAVGVVLTIVEFNKLEQQDSKSNDRPETGNSN